MRALLLLLPLLGFAQEPRTDELYPPAGKPQPPAELVRCLVKVPVRFFDYEGNAASGDLIVNKDLAADVAEVFRLIEKSRFPVKSVRVVNEFGWSDSASMLADNTSAYNFRPITGGHSLSLHATGRAIDINPYCNPYFNRGVSDPPNTRHDPSKPCALDGEKGKAVIDLFRRLGWKWGGSWTNPIDYQHFEKPGPDYCKPTTTGAENREL